METDYVDYPSTFHSNANYNAGTNGPSNTAYQSTPQSANVNPRVNFNERPRPQLLNNEPLYPSSLPPPENQQVIQPVSCRLSEYIWSNGGGVIEMENNSPTHRGKGRRSTIT